MKIVAGENIDADRAVWDKVAGIVAGQFIVATSEKIQIRPLPGRG